MIGWKLTQNEKIDDKEGMEPVRLWDKEMKKMKTKTHIKSFLWNITGEIMIIKNGRGPLVYRNTG